MVDYSVGSGIRIRDIFNVPVIAAFGLYVWCGYPRNHPNA